MPENNEEKEIEELAKGVIQDLGIETEAARQKWGDQFPLWQLKQSVNRFFKLKELSAPEKIIANELRVIKKRCAAIIGDEDATT